MSLYTEYIPKQFKDSKLHRSIIKKLKNITTIESSVIIYGPNGSGKYVLSQMCLENIFGMEIYNKNEMTIQNGKKYFVVYSSNFHYEINLKDSYIKSSELCKFIETLGKTRNIVNNNTNLIVIKNSEFLTRENIFSIKKLIEKQTLHFILLTNKLNTHLLDLNSLFMRIRVPLAERKEIIAFIKEIKKKEKIKILMKDVNEIVKKNKLNIGRILYDLKMYSLTGTYNYENILDKKLDTILGLVYNKKTSDILQIRKLLYDVCSHNINRYDILKYCFYTTLKKINTTKKKLELLEFTAEINNKLSYSFKNIIHIEYYLIKLMDFIE
jgi:hypothetical protein